MPRSNPQITFLSLYKTMAFCLCFALFTQLTLAQLPSFSLQIHATPETCAGNGALAFAVNGQNPAATIVFQIYRLPDVAVPVSTQSAATISGLSAGNYRVIATQSLLSDSNTQQAEATVAGGIVVLSYQLIIAKAICGNDGRVTVNISDGTATSYEIFSGPQIRPPQLSNIFNLLPAGSYQMRVFDGCGQGLVQNFIIDSAILGNTITHQGFGIGTSCSNIMSYDFMVAASALGEIAFPITVLYTVHPPTGPPQLFTQAIPFSGNPSQQLFSQAVPMFYNQTYDYNIKVTDHCGNATIGPTVSLTPKLELNLYKRSLGCNDFKLEVHMNEFGTPPFNVEFTSSPAGFNPNQYNSGHPGPFNTSPAVYYNPAVHFPVGFYEVKITDACGRAATHAIYLDYDVVPPGYFVEFQRPGCALGFASLRLFNTLDIYNAEVISAPASYLHALPYNVNYCLSAHQLHMEGLPAGTYIFKTTDLCNNTQTVSVLIDGYHTNHTVGVERGCNSFNLQLDDSSNSYAPTFWLQKLDVGSGVWGNPQTGFSDGSEPNASNSVQLYNNTLNLNLAYTGTFKVLKKFPVFSNADVLFNSTCIEDLEHFDFTGQPEFIDIHSFQCSPNLLDVLLVATGAAPLTYYCTTRNGIPFAINNGTSNIFLGLQPGTYNFQVRDACGNILNRLYDINVPVNLTISPANFCEGQAASLSVPGFSFLNYKWWKGNDSAAILSNTNQLLFPSFNPATDGGIYHVNIKYPNPNSCIDLTLDYDLNVFASAAEAGVGTEVAYCVPPSSIDLFSLLSGNYSSGGTWQDIDASGSLMNSNWLTAGLTTGTYHFKYIVTGLCSSAETIVTIHLNKLPEDPIVTSSYGCAGNNINFNCQNAANTTYQWSGPNGFSSTISNPIILNASILMNGIYSVTASMGSCTSEASTVDVTINAIPELSISTSCLNNNFALLAIPLNNSFDAQAVTFSWSGPAGFLGDNNPATIIGNQPGEYHVTVTTAAGCAATADIEVGNTLCGYPQILSPNEDGQNDTFDLSGFEVQSLEIMNRWGRRVFQQSNYTNEWHGQNQSNNQLPSGTYYYYAKLKSGDVKNGWVFITDKI